MDTWTLHVEHFGKIKCADIEAAQITLFVGDNNSGKSYLMTLIYGLLNTDFYTEQYTFNEQSENYLRCKEFIDEIYENAEPAVQQIKLSPELIKAFEGVLNELLSLNKDRFIRDLFNRQISIGNLSLKFKEENEYALEFDLSFSHEHQELISIIGISNNDTTNIRLGCSAIKNSTHGYNFMTSYIINYMIKGYFNEIWDGHSTYFPTARTGYILTYKSLIGSAIKDKFNLRTTQKNLLTKPNSDFLAKLSGITESELTGGERQMINRTQPAIDIIENKIIGGKVSISNMPAQDVLYHPYGTDVQLPMFVTSGVVTEMTPLLLFFKNEILETVFIEEPEISLHPELQCEMARVLIRLANSKIPVFVTTHSDIILQHINNMIKLDRVKNRETIAKKLGYEAYDWINRKKVNVYQFDTNNSQETTVTQLPCGEFGFEAMTFYNTLEKLNQQITIIEEE